MTLGVWLITATAQLAEAGVVTARLDSLVLLADALDKDKSWVLAHGDGDLPANILPDLQTKIAARAARQPLAYIRGVQEFYGRDFTVNPHVLIPRPETEMLIELLKEYRPARILDVGTGSGAIAITAALELPGSHVEACDISQTALTITAKNAQILGAAVTFFESDLLANVTNNYDAIVANLPYVDSSWQRSPETNAEPKLALFAADGGLEIIKRLLAQTPDYLCSNGYLLLEADPRQHAAIIAAAASFRHVTTKNFVVALQKI